MISRILSLFETKDVVPQKELARIHALPPAESRTAFAEMLHDLCVKHAAEYINRELHKKDSPYRAVDKSRYFHEVMILNLWALQKTFRTAGDRLVEDVHACYVKTFHPEDGPVTGYSLEEIREKHRDYGFEWDEISGHQDEFALHVAEKLFGSKEAITSPPVVSFWIVEYVHALLKKLKALKKRCAAAGIEV